MRVFQEEIFGPVVSVTTFTDFDDAMRIANDTLYGLGAGDVDGTPFHMSGPQFAYWSHTHLTVDVVPGRGSGFSVEAPRGVRFLIRSRLYDEAEQAALEAEGPPPTGPLEG